MKIDNLIIYFFFFIFNLALKFIFENYYYKINIYDYPKKNIKDHNIKTPVYGGVIFFLNFLLFFILDNLFFKIFFKEINYFSLSILFASIFVFFIGILDDIKNLKPIYKSIYIFGVLFIFLILNENLIISSIKLDLFRTINLNFFSFSFTIICIFIFMNAYNMLDGVDLNIAFFNFFVLVFLIYKTNFNLLFVIFFIANCFFLYLNYKKKTFFGNNGSYFFSFFLAFSFIYFFKKNESVNETQITLLLIFPIIELIRLFISRIFKKRSPFDGDLEHFHHFSTKVMGKIAGVMFCQALISFPIIIYFLTKINMWLVIFIFLFLYILSINLLKNLIKKKRNYKVD